MYLNDIEMAKKLQQEEFEGRLRDSSEKQEKKQSSLVDPTWELIDPNPNIYSLFQAFDKKFFGSTLGIVEVKWSPNMYKCAGLCTYKGIGGCVISLSVPLLKLRPRKDLIETLLHEMIHAYLFLHDRDRDRDGHGPKFHAHMHRINAEAGTHITVCHSFHDEVRHYKTHWWRCDGPCRFQKPFFGVIKRAMNRTPDPSDNWYLQHQMTCGGSFIQIQEPEGFKSRKKKVGQTQTVSGMDIKKKLDNFDKPIENQESFSKTTENTVACPVCEVDVNCDEVNTHLDSCVHMDFSYEPINSVDACIQADPSSFVDLTIDNPSTSSGFTSNPPSRTKGLFASCPVCDNKIFKTKMDEHLDQCLSLDSIMDSSNQGIVTGYDTDRAGTSDDSDVEPTDARCPCCDRRFSVDAINAHLDGCLQSLNFD